MNALARRDVVIDQLAYELAVRDEQLVEVVQERDVYRELSQAALAALANLTRAHGRLRDGHHQLLDQYRALQEQLNNEVEGDHDHDEPTQEDDEELELEPEPVA